jgi:hypothetical protein
MPWHNIFPLLPSVTAKSSEVRNSSPLIYLNLIIILNQNYNKFNIMPFIKIQY